MAVVLGLTKHFLRRWEERVGAAPTLDGINRLLGEGHRVRRQMRLFRREGRKLEPVKVLALYWHPTSQVIIWVDEDRRVAVTVVSAHTARSLGQGGQRWK